MEIYAPDICIYHENCDDGFASAWIISNVWRDVDFRPCTYGNAVPDHDIDGKHVIIVDFSFKKDVLTELAKRAASIVILDHHKTARNGLVGLPTHPSLDRHIVTHEMKSRGANILLSFDMDKSGARMTWEFCHPGVEPSDFILAIEDRDLWALKLPDSKLVAMYLRTVERTFANWDHVEWLYEHERDQFLRGAKLVDDFYWLRIREIMDNAVKTHFHGFDNVAIVHLPESFASDTLNALLNKHPDIPFAVGVVDKKGIKKFSMRSRDGGVDVSEIALKFGGGGHHSAASFRI